MAAPRLKQRYNDEILGKVMSEFGITNKLAAPYLDKIVLSVGMGRQLEGTKLNPKAREQVIEDLGLMTGQRPVMKRAKRSVSNFKLRAGYEVGCMVTLRRDRMWEFLDRLVNLAIPRIKDFRGLSEKSFDGRGNYAFGIVEQGIFPEIDMTNAQFSHGMNLNFAIKNSSDEMSRFLLRELGMPFERKETPAGAAA